MSYKISSLTASLAVTLGLFCISQPLVIAAPGSIGQIPLFVAPPTQPNIFFMLDDSGSMDWTMPADGVFSNTLILLDEYDTIPDDDREWRSWCLGANFMAYNPAINYRPWAANIPGTSTPFPDQTDLTNVRVNPMELGTVIRHKDGENNIARGRDNEIIDLSAAPVVLWSDAVVDGGDGDGLYDAGECPGGTNITGYLDPRVRRADSLSAAEQINFANWFSYYRTREYTTKAAVSQVVSNSSARMGMATLHGNNGVGVRITDMTVAANKGILLDDVVRINSSGGTPLRRSLNRVGEYFRVGTNAPSGLNIGSVPSPILSAANGGECQQNFTMLMTDGQWNGGSPSVGSQDAVVDSDFVYPAHQDGVSDTLADVAMRWYKTDLAPALDNKVPVQSGASSQNLDENKQQHMVTFGVAFGPNGSVANDPTDKNSAFPWPTPVANSDETVDDLRHAAYNSRGKFLSANNPETLISALQDVISDIESRQGSAAAVSFSSTTLVSGTSLYFASFDTVGWTGSLRSFGVNTLTGELSVSPNWNAASVLDGKSNVDMLSRTIYTWGKISATEDNGVLFNWSVTDPQPVADIINDLRVNPDRSVELTPFSSSQERLNFLRGDLSRDGIGLIRDRASRLGDIINSAPRFVGVPVSNWPDSDPFGSTINRYSSYQSGLTALSRDGVVYVGANDGLLHGFKESDGEEVLAYLPSAPASTTDNTGFHYLTESDYQHRYYVDGLPVSADVYMPIEPAGTSDWRTILVGALGGGGRGLYALDVTNPANFTNTQTAAKDVVLWEFTDQHDADLGFSFSVPQITMMNNDKWAVVIGNGYNATGTDNAKLMILFIEEGLDGAWSVGDYVKIDTGAGAAINKNGLSTPTLVDLDHNGTTDRIYAGDLLGNMWAFDVSDAAAADWEVAYQDTSSNPKPLFTATHHAGDPAVLVSSTPQPITMKPLVAKVDWVTDDTTNAPNMMVYFGTGQYIATGDAANTDQQSFYGVWDAGASVSATNLVEQTFASGFPISARVLTQNPVTLPAPSTTISTASELGWFINLPETGERVVVDAFTLEGLIFFNTLTPSDTPCSAGGASWLMAVNMQTGANPSIAAIDISGDGYFDSSDTVSDGTNDYYAAGVVFGHGIASATAVITNADGKSFGYISGTDSNDPHLYNLPGSVATGVRKSWRQLFN